jgi:4'-phosphopantetheinyl transferase
VDVLELPENEVHVYYLESEKAAPGDGWLRVLSPAERERHARFIFEKDRRIFLLAHALTRLALARYTGMDAESLEFDTNKYGKPSLRTPGFGFNLSHTRGFVALAVAREPETGVDVEDTGRTTDWAGLAPRVFTEAEQAGLWARAPQDRQRRFYELWTLKEAYIKARGMGLALPLDGFSMGIPQHGPIGIGFGPAIADDASTWQFELFEIASFRLAVAVRIRQGQRSVRLFAGETSFPL